MKTNRTLLTLAAALALAATTRAEDLIPIVITELSMTQDRSTQDVTIKYKFSNDGYPAIVRFDILTNGASIGASHFKHVTGDFSSNLTQTVADDSQQKTITWKARTDWFGHLATDAVASVTAYYTNDISYVAGAYLVVDLSDGPNATSYPVSYTLTPPDPSNDVTCCSNKLWLKRVAGGTFKMGSPTNEIGRALDTSGAYLETLHNVTLSSDFFVGVLEVTQAQYALVMGSCPSGQVGNKLYPVGWMTPTLPRGSTKGDTWPATSAVDDDSFIGRLRSRTGLTGFDLPTEAQWEYACRAGTAGAWNSGADITNETVDLQLNALGWYKNNSDGGNKPRHVGYRLPNAWGLYDMHGNVKELCLDRYDSTTANLGSDDAYDPKGSTSTSTSARIIRGGSCSMDAKQCRSAIRVSGSLSYTDYSYGFRMIMNQN